MDIARLIIADDNEDSLEILQFYIGQLPGFTIVDRCRNGEQLIESVMRNQADIVLLDINMPKINGMDAMRACLQINPELLFIIVTSYDQYAVQAFELSALDYIVKPFDKARLYASLERAKRTCRIVQASRRNPDNPQRLIIRDPINTFYIPLMDILFIEKISKRCHIYTTEAAYTTTGTISSIMQQLPPEFFYVSHRSYIVNLAKITHIKAKNQTYLAYFPRTDQYAHISKLKIEELQNRMKLLG